jgi:hypothetical protein
MNTETIKRFEEFGQSICGLDHGWKTKFANELNIRPQQLNNLLVGSVRLGPKMQSRLRHLGADVDFILTGRNMTPLKFIKLCAFHIKEFEKLFDALENMARDDPNKFRATILKMQALVDKMK